MTREQRNDLLQAIEAMPTATTAQKARKANALRHFANIANDSGAVGRIREILDKSTYSTAYNFARQGKADCFVWIGKKRYNAERKTNGGRIGSLYGKKAPSFVVYSMDIDNAGTAHQRRVIEPIVMRTSLFLAILEENGAIKNTNGTNPDLAIQATSKKLFLALQEYTLTYDPNRRYTADDFGGNIDEEEGEA